MHHLGRWVDTVPEQFSSTCKARTVNLDGQDVVHRRARCGDTSRPTAGAYSDSKARDQEMVQGFVCSGGFARHRNRSSVYYP